MRNAFAFGRRFRHPPPQIQPPKESSNLSWYYAENNERRGPVEDAAFQSLVSAGTIKPDTLVWREGFAAWTPYASVPATAAPPSSSPASAGGIASSSAVACSQCGRSFPADETVTYEGRHVCAECKPL